MNNLFSNNIIFLSKKNPELALRLENYLPNEIPQLAKKGNIYNLYYKKQLIHNAENPLGEAQEIFFAADNEPVSIHLIYGLGLGYLFQLASLNSKGIVVLYEPDLNIMKIVFSLVDFTKDISKDNVYITDNLNDLSKILYENSGIQNLPQMLSIPYYNSVDKEHFEELVKKLQEIVGSYSLDLKYAKEKFYPALKMFLQNMPNLINETPLESFKDQLKGKTAVVASAGPTLDRDIEFIKKYRDKIVIFAVGTAVKTLYKNNITPDFITIIETYDSSKQLKGLNLENVSFITEPFSNPNLRQFKFKNTYSHVSANSPVNHFWSEISGVNIEEYWSKGTVSYMAMNCARILGCNPIVLTGQDLAYIEGQCYSKDSAYKDLICVKNSDTNTWEIQARDFDQFADAISNAQDKETRIETAKRRLNNLNSSLYYVKGIKGDMIPTESVYATFIEPLREYAEHFNDRKYINTSLVGAQIDGYENLPFEDAVKNAETVGKIGLKTNFTYDKEQISLKLKEKITELEEAFPKIQEGLRLKKTLINDIKRYRNATVEVLKSLKRLSECYLELSSKFAEKSQLFNYITLSDKVELDYLMKIVQSFDVENITKISGKIEEYLLHAQERIAEIKQLSEQTLERLK